MFTVFVCSVFLLTETVLATVPHVGGCSKRDPDLNECARKQIALFIRLTGTGVPEWNLPQSDPYTVPNLYIAGSGGSVNIDQNYTNLTLYGISKAKLTKMNLTDPGTPKMHISAVAFLKHCEMLSAYRATGRILVLTLQGHGQSTYLLDDLDVLVESDVDTYVKKGVKHLKLKNLTVELKPKSLKMELENLFDGNAPLTEQLNQVLNEHWESVFAESKFAYELIVADFLNKYINRVLQFVPYDRILME